MTLRTGIDATGSNGGISACASKPYATEARDETIQPLRILVVSQHYWPEPFNFSNICEELAARGHNVTVLTGTPNYPEGITYTGYEHGAQAEQERNGVRIKRVRLIPRHHNLFHRVLNYYSFSINGKAMARRLDGGFDVVLAFQTSPVMMAEPALAYAERHGTPVLLYCLDIWPECLTAGGIKRDSVVFKYYAHVSKRIYEAADRLAVASPLFGDYLQVTLGMEDRHPLYLPQFAEDIFCRPGADTDAIDTADSTSETAVSHTTDTTAFGRREGYDPSKFNLTFAGNIGTAQALDTLIAAASILEDDGRFAIHIVGSGVELENLKALKESLGANSVIFHGRHPLSEMPSFYASSDAMIITLRNNPLLGYTLPRKLQSYMAAGKPILGAATGETRRLIDETDCGFCCDAEDPQGFADICRRLAEMPEEERRAMGARGRNYCEEHFSKAHFFDTLERELAEVAKRSHT